MPRRGPVVLILLYALCPPPAHTQPSIIAAFTVSTDAGDTMTVHAGIAPGASPGIDAVFGEMEIPPPPPDGVFDVRFVDPDTSTHAMGEGSWRDVRDGDPGATMTHRYLLLCRPGTAPRCVVAWDLPAGVAAFLVCDDTSPPRRLVATGRGMVQMGEGRSLIAVHITVQYNVRLLTIRAVLEGAFDARAGRMHTSLLDRGVLRAHFPGRALPPDVVDSIAIELLAPAGVPDAEPPIIQPAWLLADGAVCPFSPPFDTPLVFPDALRLLVYPVIQHRNHISAVSAQAIPAGVTAADCDMTSGPEMYLDGKAVQLAPGLWGLIAGDADGDGRIGTWDHAVVRAAIGIARAYDRNDMDMNGGVGATDLALVRRSIGSPVKEP